MKRFKIELYEIFGEKEMDRFFEALEVSGQNILFCTASADTRWLLDFCLRKIKYVKSKQHP